MYNNYNSHFQVRWNKNTRKLRGFEMGVLKRIRGIGRDVEIMNALATGRHSRTASDLDINIFWTRVLYALDWYPHILVHVYVAGSLPHGRPRMKWIDNITEDCSRWRWHLSTLQDLLKTETKGGTYNATWDASMWESNLSHRGIKSSKQLVYFFATNFVGLFQICPLSSLQVMTLLWKKCIHRVRKKRCHFIFACNSAKC